MSYNTTAWTTDGQTQTTGGATLYKDFGLFDFSPVAGKHNPMIELNTISAASAATYSSNDVGDSGTDPPTTVDVSDDADNPRSLFASIWYIEDNIAIDSARVIVAADGSQAINFHVMSYDIDTSSNYGDLSGGTLLAHIGSSISATSSTVKTDTLTIDSSSVSSSKVIIAFAEAETDTTDISCKMTIKYHLT